MVIDYYVFFVARPGAGMEIVSGELSHDIPGRVLSNSMDRLAPLSSFFRRSSAVGYDGCRQLVCHRLRKG